MTNTRRTLMIGAAALSPAACGTPTVSTTFATNPGYVAEADALVDKLLPLVQAVSPAEAALLAPVVAKIDAAAAAFAALTSPPSGATDVQDIITWLDDALGVAAAALPQYAPEIGAAEVLLVLVGDFFGGLAPASKVGLALGRPSGLWDSAAASYRGASDKAAFAAGADAKVRAWLAAH